MKVLALSSPRYDSLDLDTDLCIPDIHSSSTLVDSYATRGFLHTLNRVVVFGEVLELPVDFVSLCKLSIRP